MRLKVGSLLQFVGGAIGRVATSGLIIGIFFVLVGVTPWQYVASLLQGPPEWMSSVWFSPTMALIGLVLIVSSLWFNLWSQKQKAIDDLAEDIAWAQLNLLHRPPPVGTDLEAAKVAWRQDCARWRQRVSKQLDNRAFFTRADQVHFDYPGVPVGMSFTGHVAGDEVSGMTLRLDHLRDILNWVQQRRR